MQKIIYINIIYVDFYIITQKIDALSKASVIYIF